MNVLIRISFLVLLVGLFMAELEAAACNSFQTKCPVVLGQVIADNNKPVKLLNQSQYYISFDVRQLPVIISSLDFAFL